MTVRVLAYDSMGVNDMSVNSTGVSLRRYEL